MSETEITTPVSVLDDFGRPCNFGWARSPCFIYNSSLLRAPRWNIRESDRYILFSPSHLIVFEILDDGYLGHLCISTVFLKDKTRSTHIKTTPFSLGRFELPKDSDSLSIKYRKKESFLNFAVMDEGVRIIKVDIPKFSRKGSLRGQVVLSPPPEAESFFYNTPLRGRRKAFCFSRRSPWYSAEGVIQLGTTEILFTGGKSWGIFDWNRGVRPRSDLRLWASGCGMSGGRQAGFSLGFSVGFNLSDSVPGTENAFFMDGKIHKLDRVSFHIPSDRHLPWRFSSNDNRLEMTFSPQQERQENRQMFFYSLRRRQFFGSFSGKVILDNGDEYRFSDIAGMAERIRSRL